MRGGVYIYLCSLFISLLSFFFSLLLLTAKAHNTQETLLASPIHSVHGCPCSAVAYTAEVLPRIEASDGIDPFLLGKIDDFVPLLGDDFYEFLGGQVMIKGPKAIRLFGSGNYTILFGQCTAKGELISPYTITGIVSRPSHSFLKEMLDAFFICFEWVFPLFLLVHFLFPVG